jgi:hypothetical protein
LRTNWNFFSLITQRPKRTLFKIETFLEFVNATSIIEGLPFRNVEKLSEKRPFPAGGKMIAYDNVRHKTSAIMPVTGCNRKLFY